MASDRLDEAGALGRIAQHVPDLADRLVEAVVEVYGRLWPESAA